RPWGVGHTVLCKDDIDAITVDEVVQTVKNIPSLRESPKG
ncbi:unnamed protein product, partial [marine sediment metagenome]